MAVVIIALIGMLVYINVLDGRFVFDDELLIVRNTLIHSLDNLGQFFSTSITQGAFVSDGNFYRPLQTIIFAIIYQLFGLQPFPFHLLSVAIHIINSWLIYRLLKKLELSNIASLLAVTFFLIHPVQTQAVSYISGLADPLGLMLLLLSVFSFLKLFTIKNAKTFLRYSALTLSLIILALLTKESMIVIAPVLLMLYLLQEENKKQKKLYRKITYVLTATFILTGIYILLRFSVLNFTNIIGLNAEESIYTQNVWVRIATFINNIPSYLRLLVYPSDLYYERGNNFFTEILTLKGLLGLLSIGLIAGIFIYGYKKQLKILSYGSAWIFITFFPYIGIIPLNATYLEHWLYISMVGIVMIIAFFLEKLNLKKHPFMIAILLITFLLLGLRTVARNNEWRYPILFYINEVAHNPHSARMYNNLAGEFANAGRTDIAEATFLKALEYNQDYPQIYFNLGNLYDKLNRKDEAEKQYLQALLVDPNFIYAHGKLAQFYKDAGDNKAAQEFFTYFDSLYKGSEISGERVKTLVNSQLAKLEKKAT